MFDHVTIRVKDFGKAKHFYKESLAALGFEVHHESADVGGRTDALVVTPPAKNFRSIEPPCGGVPVKLE